MESLKAWAIGLCAAALCGSILRKIAPEKGSGKVFRVLLSVFFICAFFSPLLSLFSVSVNLSLDRLPTELQHTVLEDTVSARLQKTVKSAAAEVAESTLAARGITAEKITVTTDIAADQSIYIARVEVTLSKRSRARRAEAREVLENRLGCEVTVREAVA